MSMLSSGGGGSATPVDATEDTALATVGDTILHLHCEGANDGAVFTDSAPAPATITRTGTIVTSTAQAKFGSASMSLANTSGNRLTVDLSGKALPYFGDWTAEFWLYLNAAWGTHDGRLIVSPGSGLALWLTSAGAINFYAGVRDGAAWDVQVTSGYTIPTGGWHHVAAVKYREAYSIFVDGTQRGSTSRVAGPTWWSDSIFIGDSSTNGHVDGFLDEIRISRGAKYLAGFTPSAAAFADASTLAGGARLGEIRSDGAGGLWICTNASASPQGWRRVGGPGYLVA